MLATAVFGWQRIFDFGNRTTFRDFVELADGTMIFLMTTSGMLDSTDNAVYVVGLRAYP